MPSLRIMGFTAWSRPVNLLALVNPVTGKTIDWRAVCGPAKLSGMPVQFEGWEDRETDLFYPYQDFLIVHTACAPVRYALP